MSDDSHSSFLKKKPSKKRDQKQQSTIDTSSEGSETFYDKRSMANTAVKLGGKSMFGRRSGTR